MQRKNNIITVGLPVYASPIAWLAMESLCRQKTTCDWELIIHEDEEQALGIDFYKQYSERLALVNCVSVHYKYEHQRTSLSKKWCDISNIANNKSIGIILQASDCYSEPNRIQTAFDKMSEGYDWLHSSRGVFYYVQQNKTIEFDIDGFPTGLNMCMNKSIVQQIPIEDKWSSVDNWLITNLFKIKPDLKVYLFDGDAFLHGLDTDGFNRISLARRDQYSEPKPPFKKTHLTADKCLPEEIYKKLSEWK